MSQISRKRLYFLATILVGIFILFLSGCTNYQGKTSDILDLINFGNAETGDFELEYCKTAVRTGTLDLKAAERRVEKETRDIETFEDRLRQARLTGTQEDVEEKQEDLNLAEQSLDNAKKEVNQARSAMQSIVKKCNTLKAGYDKAICDEFVQDTSLKLAAAYRELRENQDELKGIEAMLKEAKSAGRPSAVISSIEKEIQEENFNILKVKNRIDNHERMKKELEVTCKA